MRRRKDPEELVARVVKALDGGFSKASDAAVVAKDIYALRELPSLAHDARIEPLVDKWRAIAGAIPTLVESRVDYFVRLACAPGPLLGEELLKLWSLGEEIHVLSAFGFAPSVEQMTELEAALRERLRRQPDLRTEASHAEGSFRTSWCYRVALPSSRKR